MVECNMKAVYTTDITSLLFLLILQELYTAHHSFLTVPHLEEFFF